MIRKKIEELQDVVQILTDKTTKEIEDFPIMTAEEILDCANVKDGLMREFIQVKAELDVLMHGKPYEEVLEYEDAFIDLEEKMMKFKIQNRRLMLLTVPIQEMYNNINEKVKQTGSRRKNLLNTSV